MADPTVVIDNGAYSLKAGFSGDDAPKSITPTLVAKNKSGNQLIGQSVRDAAEELSLTVPIERGVITKWDEMTTLWTSVFTDSLKADPSNCKVLLTDSPTNPKECREKMAQIMFEKFNVKKFSVANQSVLSLYASGRMSGLVVDSGYSVTHAVPIYEGFAVTEGIEKLSLGGQDLLEFMQDIISSRGTKFPNSNAAVFEPLHILEKLGKVALDYEKEEKMSSVSKYLLPDGTDVIVDPLAMYCPEIIFNPHRVDPNLEMKGIQHLVNTSLKKCEIDVRGSLLSNVLLAGGTTLFPGFPERFVKEVTSIAGPNVKVITKPERNLYAWIGGSVMTSLDAFNEKWITRDEYQDQGAGIVSKKCA